MSLPVKSLNHLNPISFFTATSTCLRGAVKSARHRAALDRSFNKTCAKMPSTICLKVPRRCDDVMRSSGEVSVVDIFKGRDMLDNGISMEYLWWYHVISICNIYDISWSDWWLNLNTLALWKRLEFVNWDMKSLDNARSHSKIFRSGTGRVLWMDVDYINMRNYSKDFSSFECITQKGVWFVFFSQFHARSNSFQGSNRMVGPLGDSGPISTSKPTLLSRNVRVASISVNFGDLMFMLIWFHKLKLTHGKYSNTEPKPNAWIETILNTFMNTATYCFNVVCQISLLVPVHDAKMFPNQILRSANDTASAQSLRVFVHFVHQTSCKSLCFRWNHINSCDTSMFCSASTMKKWRIPASSTQVDDIFPDNDAWIFRDTPRKK